LAWNIFSFGFRMAFGICHSRIEGKLDFRPWACENKQQT
jgi:hypothetical protein